VAENGKKTTAVGMGPKRQSPAGKAKAAKGVESLREAAGQKVEQHSEEIAESLYQRAVDGDLKSAQLLISLAELHPDGEETETSRPIWSSAMQLAAEPRWGGELTEEAAGTGAGSLESES
jgi:hypothetical protein